MATVTLNRTTQVLRLDLTNPEFAIIDPYVQRRGVAELEALFAGFIASIRQVSKESDLENIRARINSLPDDKRASVLAIIASA